MIESSKALFTIREVGEILGSSSEGDPGFHQTPIYGVSTDSRNIEPDELFVALHGANHNGHDHIDEALEHGASAAIIEKKEASKRNLKGPKYIVVENSLYALGQLAKYYRNKIDARIIGVTGSNGKTTVKNLVYEIISNIAPSLKSQGNFNNLIGLPNSIFSLTEKHKYAVFELGMSARGEIRRLSEIASPDIAVITNVGPVHLEFLKTIEEVAKAKLEIIENLKSGSYLVINGDDKLLTKNLKKANLNIIKFGLAPSNDIFPSELEYDNDQKPHFKIDKYDFHPNLPGIHNVYNILAAMGVAKALNTDMKKAAEAINAFVPEGMRSEIVHVGGMTLLIDCYNANPTSMKFALETLSKINTSGRKIAILADMLELGEHASDYHKEIGSFAKNNGIDIVLAYGPLSKGIIEGFGKSGRHFTSKPELIKILTNYIKPDDAILFKGSRGMALEEVVKEIRGKL